MQDNVLNALVERLHRQISTEPPATIPVVSSTHYSPNTLTILLSGLVEFSESLDPEQYKKLKASAFGSGHLAEEAQKYGEEVTKEMQRQLKIQGVNIKRNSETAGRQR